MKASYCNLINKVKILPFTANVILAYFLYTVFSTSHWWMIVASFNAPVDVASLNLKYQISISVLCLSQRPEKVLI